MKHVGVLIFVFPFIAALAAVFVGVMVIIVLGGLAIHLGLAAVRYALTREKVSPFQRK